MSKISELYQKFSYFLSFDSLIVFTTILALTSFLVGCVGIGFYIPANNEYNSYMKTLCYIVDHEYDACNGDYQTPGACYSAIWSVEYYASSRGSTKFTFSTIKHTYDTPDEALSKLYTHTDDTNHTCYYHNEYISNVQWEQPDIPTKYLIMTVIPFTFVGVYLVFLGITFLYQYRKRYASIMSM